MFAISITLFCRQDLAIADQIGYIVAVAIAAQIAILIALIMPRSSRTHIRIG